MTLLAALIGGGFFLLLLAGFLGGLCWTARHSDPDIAEALGTPSSSAPADSDPASDSEPACAVPPCAIQPGAGEYFLTWACLCGLSLSLSTLLLLGVVKVSELVRNH